MGGGGARGADCWHICVMKVSIERHALVMFWQTISFEVFYDGEMSCLFISNLSTSCKQRALHSDVSEGASQDKYCDVIITTLF